jgi:glycosyltransferase involved in cell wall biosynthesis
MNILHISPIYPFPPVMANQKDITGRLMLFKELGYEVHSFSYPLHWQKFDVKKDEKKYGIKISILERGFTYDAFRNRLFAYWYKTKPLLNRNSFRAVLDHVKENAPAVIWLEYSALSPLTSILKDVSDAKIIIRAHNFELQHYWEKEWINIKEKKGGLSRIPYYLRELLGILHSEKLMLEKADKVACISRGDLKLYKRYFRSTNVFYLPFYSPDKITAHRPKKQINVLNAFYMGSNLRNNVNLHGALYIINKILPATQKKYPNKFVFHILGKYGTEQLSDYTDRTLRVHDYVEDLNSFLESMDIALLPVFYGTGFKVKTYECLKRGFPTIGSPRAFRGLNGIEGEHFLTATNPESFAEGLGKLLDEDLRWKLSKNASELIKKDFSKEHIKKQLTMIIGT